MLCFKLCFTFYNFSGSVKVPAPVKYADRQAAFLQEIQKKPHAHFKT
jgi:argonaute-like protein implicated in RNA metabolism and viral defense